MNLKNRILSYTLIGATLISGSAMAFTDTESHWAKEYVDEMTSMQILKGYPDGLFRPECTISREETAQMISNFLGGSGTGEVPHDAIDRWSTEAVRNLAGQKIMTGYEDGLFRPEKQVTRAELAKILYKVMNLKTDLTSAPVTFGDTEGHWAQAEIEALAGIGVVKGYEDGLFKTENSATRAEASAMLYRAMRLIEDPGYKEPTPARYFKFSKTSGTIYHYNDTPYDPAPKDVVIPEEIDGVKVREIGMWAFRASFDPADPTDKFRKSKISSVVIPYGVEKIDTEAFLYNELTEVIIPDSVTEIGSDAFSGNKLSSAKLPSNLTEIKDSIFSGNRLKEVNIPDGVISIGRNAFSGNELESIDIPKDVSYIGDGAFRHNQLKTVSLPDEITNIGDWTFANNKLTSVDIPDKITSIGESAFRDNQISSLTVPPSAMHLGLWAFAGNNLTRVEIPRDAELESSYDSVNDKFLYPFDESVEIIRY